MRLTDTPLTGSQSTKIESRAMTLLFVITTNANTYAAAKTAMAATKLTLEKQTSSGVQVIASEEILLDILEYSAAETGSVQVVEATGATEIRGSYELCDTGALQFDDSRDLKIKFSGIPTNYAVDVYALDAPNLGNGYTNCIERVPVTSGTPKVIPCQAAKTVFIPKTGFVRLELFYPNGQVITMLAEEMKHVAAETNELARIGNGLVTSGGGDYYQYNVADCPQIRVTTSADSIVKKITYRYI